MGLVVDANDKSIQILHELQKKLLDLYQAGKKVVLIIDEAQQMPLSTLEEIRLLSNLETETEKLLQIILFGQPELDEHLDTPQIRQLRERITYSFYLTALDWKVADTYLHFRLKKAGHQGRTIFEINAIKLLAKYSDGTLRRMNVLADKAMLAAFLDKSPAVEAKHIRLAMKDSQKSNKKNNAWAYVLIAFMVFLSVTGVAYWFMVSQSPQVSEDMSIVQENAPEVAKPAVATLSIERVQNRLEQEIDGDLLKQRLGAFENWYKIIGKKYTLQLFSSKRDADSKSVRRFLNKVKSSIGVEYVFVRRLGDEEPSYIVYYQSFDHFLDAKKVLENLPTTIRKFQPYIQIVPQ